MSTIDYFSEVQMLRHTAEKNLNVLLQAKVEITGGLYNRGGLCGQHGLCLHEARILGLSKVRLSVII